MKKALCGLVIVMVVCVFSLNLFAAAPVIKKVTPNKVFVGSNITVTGEQFNSPEINVVSLRLTNSTEWKDYTMWSNLAGGINWDVPQTVQEGTYDLKIKKKTGEVSNVIISALQVAPEECIMPSVSSIDFSDMDNMSSIKVKGANFMPSLVATLKGKNDGKIYAEQQYYIDLSSNDELDLYFNPDAATLPAALVLSVTNQYCDEDVVFEASYAVPDTTPKMTVVPTSLVLNQKIISEAKFSNVDPNAVYLIKSTDITISSCVKVEDTIYGYNKLTFWLMATPACSKFGNYPLSIKIGGVTLTDNSAINYPIPSWIFKMPLRTFPWIKFSPKL